MAVKLKEKSSEPDKCKDMDEDTRRIAFSARATHSAEKSTQEAFTQKNSQTGVQVNEQSERQNCQRKGYIHNDPSLTENSSTNRPIPEKQQRDPCPKIVNFEFPMTEENDLNRLREHFSRGKDVGNSPEQLFYNTCQLNEEAGNDEVFYDAFRDMNTHIHNNDPSQRCERSVSRNNLGQQQDVFQIQYLPSNNEFVCSPTSVIPNTSSSMADYHETSINSGDNSPRASMGEALKSEKAFIEYVMSLPCSPTPPETESQRIDSGRKPRSKVLASTATSSTTKVGLDHLDNLCKLMEQLSELRETNTKLQKRVQYLEDVKTLHEMHKEIRCDAQYGSENMLTLRRQMRLKKSMTSTDHVKRSPRGSEDFDVTLVPTTTIQFRKDKKLSHKSRPTTNSIYDGRRRERSKSVGHEEAFDGKSKRIFPKWSKVKEALGWDRSVQGNQAKTNCQECHTDRKDSGARLRLTSKICGEQKGLPFNDISAPKMPHYSEYPDREELSRSGSVTGDGWKYSPALHSSAEDIAGLMEVYCGRENYKRYSETSAKNLLLLEPPSDGLRRQKSTPSPSSERGRHCQDILDLKPKSLTIERDIDAEQAFAKYEKEDAKKPNKSPWGRVKTIIEKRRDSLKWRHQRKGPEPDTACLARRCGSESKVFEEIPMRSEDLVFQIRDESPRRKSSDDKLSQSLPHDHYLLKSLRNVEELDNSCRKEKRAFSIREPEATMEDLQSSSFRASKASSIQRSLQSHDIIRAVDNEYFPTGGRSGDLTRTPSSSPPFHRRSRWGRVKKVLRGRKDGEGNELSSLSMPASPDGIHEVAFDFEDADIMEDEGEGERFMDDRDGTDMEKGNSREFHHYPSSREITRVGSDSFVHKLSLSSAAPVSDILQHLQRNLSEDFNRKIQEWERIRSTGGYRPMSPKWERKNSAPKSRSKKQDKSKTERFEKSVKPKIKDLNWLEKELQKIEKEKQRLSKEKQKYEERAFRLERLRQTVLTAGNSRKKEVLVRTSAGEFRFEGISDAFTKKLYEWETKRGVGPELSTIALLDSSLGANNKVCLSIQHGEKCPSLQRAISRSESSLMEIGQPSHTSSNSLPSLKPPDISDIERIHQLSRASSEPDLHSLSAIANSSHGSNNNDSNFNCGVILPQSITSFTNISPDEGTSKDSLEESPENIRHSYAPAEVTELIDCETGDRLHERKEAEREMEEEQREENYYSLLEENVFLLEKLKKKEDICRTLEKELELLDEKVEEMNAHHQKEMERYKEKLWEMHKPGNTPRDVQGCIQIISELKIRIEELEKCSERLKNDRENIQDSFRFHSEQQEHMTLDLLNKMRELQEAGREPSPESLSPEEKGGKRSKRNLLPIFDLKILERLQDLSGQLMQQTGELEQALAERSQQICQLRWELLHRDVSTVRLETELHSAHIRGNQPPCRSKCETKRSKYAHFRSWSSEEASSRAKQQSEINNEIDRLAHRSQDTYHNLTKADFQTANLTCTVNELNKELLRLSSAAETFFLTNATECEESPRAAETERDDVSNFGQAAVEVLEDGLSHSNKSIFHGINDDKRLKEVCRSGASCISVRRNSVGNISSVSGPDASESSSLNESEWNPFMSVTKTFHQQQHKNNISISSEDLTDEESFTSVSLGHAMGLKRPKKSSTVENEMILKYPSRKFDFENKDHSIMRQSLSEATKKASTLDSRLKPINNFGISKSESARTYEISRKHVSTPKRSMSSRERREGKELGYETYSKNVPSNLKTIYFHSHNLKGHSHTKMKEHKKGIRAKNCEFKSWNSSKLHEKASAEDMRKDKESDSTSVVVLKLPKKRNKSNLRLMKQKNCGEEYSTTGKRDCQGSKAVITVTMVLPRQHGCEENSATKLLIQEDVMKPFDDITAEDALIKKCEADDGMSSFRSRIDPGKNNNGNQNTSSMMKISCDEINLLQNEKETDTLHDVDIPKGKYSPSNSSNDCIITHIPLKKDIITKDQAASEVLKTYKPQGNEHSTSILLEKSFETTNANTNSHSAKFSSGYVKSPSAPQLDWKKTCAKKTSREGAPNVRALVEKYNQKASVKTIIGVQGSPKINNRSQNENFMDANWRYKEQSEQTNGTEISKNPPSHYPKCSYPSSLELKTSADEKLYSPPVSPPTSPASKARAEALHRAKEKFISSSNVATFKLKESEKEGKSISNSETSEVVISGMERNSKWAKQQDSLSEDDISHTSTRSMDSVSLVVYRTGESCQESRISRKSDGTKDKVAAIHTEDKQLCPSKSLSSSSMMKLVTGHDIKLPSGILNLKLRRSKKKKDMSTVAAFCRQSLLVGSDVVVKTNEPCIDDLSDRKKTSKSCPSSPELKSKSKSKTSWLHRNIFKQKH